MIKKEDKKLKASKAKNDYNLGKKERQLRKKEEVKGERTGGKRETADANYNENFRI